jgi:hypothetical protein
LQGKANLCARLLRREIEAYSDAIISGGTLRSVRESGEPATIQTMHHAIKVGASKTAPTVIQSEKLGALDIVRPTPYTRWGWPRRKGKSFADSGGDWAVVAMPIKRWIQFYWNEM